MNKQEYRNIFEHEAEHFFYVANNNLYLSYIKNLTEKRKSMSILDVGCGAGYLAKQMAKYAHVQGVDMHPQALLYSRKRGLAVKKASVTKLPYKNNSFDVVTCIDVLCHKSIKNDRIAFAELSRIIKPGGFLIVRVPALPLLFSRHDKYVETRERYSKAKFKKRLLSAGFMIKKLSYINFVLFLPALIKVLIERNRKNKDHMSVITNINPVLNAVARYILTLDNVAMKLVSLPIGNGLFAVVQKPK